MTVIERAILICAIAASRPRKRPGKIGDSSDEGVCVYTAKITDEIGWKRTRDVDLAIGLATYARDQAAESGWIHKRTQESDAEAEAWLQELREDRRRKRRRMRAARRVVSEAVRIRR